MTKRAVKFMRESVEREQPFFLQLSHYAVHSNIVYSDASYAEVGKREKGKLHKNQGYAAMLEDMDLSIGSLLEAYSELDLAKDTYIIFLSDNGGMPVLPMRVNRGRPYKAGLNAPLLRGKWDLTEGGIRVPFAITGPNINAGGQSDTPVMSYDILPTIADLAGSQKGLPKHLDGVSFKPLFDDKDADLERPFDGLVFHYPHYNRVGMNEPHSAIRYENYKLIHFPASSRNLLFDLAKDPGERVDLSEKMPKLVESLNIKLDAYLTSVDAQIPEDAGSWKRVGKNGKVRSKFFKRYDRL
jgi:arylsulfatase A-like enzyme